MIVIDQKSSLDFEAKKFLIFTINVLQELGFKVFMCRRSRKGSLIKKGSIILDDNCDFLYTFLSSQLKKYRIKVRLYKKGVPSGDVVQLAYPLIGILSCNGVSSESVMNISSILNSLGFFRKIFLTPEALDTQLKNLDVLIIPAGDSTQIAMEIGEERAKRIYDFVLSGGSLIGICAGAFLLLKLDGKALSPTDDQYVLTQNMLGQIQADLVNNTSSFTFVGWKYKRFRDGSMRVYPIAGPISCKLQKKDSLLFEIPKKFELWQEGPVAYVKDDSEVLIKGDVLDVGKRIGASFRDNTRISNFDVLVVKKVGSGSYFFVSSRIENKKFVWGQMILANILLSLKQRTNYEQNVLESPVSFDFKVVQRKFMNLRYLAKSFKKLSNVLTISVPSLYSIFPEYLFYEVLDSANSLRLLGNKATKLLNKDIRMLIEMKRLRNLEISFDELNYNLRNENDKLSLDLILRTRKAMEYYFNYSEKAVSALSALVSKMEKEANEIQLEILSGDIDSSFTRLKLLLCNIHGGYCMVYPWYEEYKKLEKLDEQCYPGVFSPFLGIEGEAIRLLSISRFLRNSLVDSN